MDLLRAFQLVGLFLSTFEDGRPDNAFDAFVATRHSIY